MDIREEQKEELRRIQKILCQQIDMLAEKTKEPTNSKSDICYISDTIVRLSNEYGQTLSCYEGLLLSEKQQCI